MKLIASRQLAARPGKVWEMLNVEGSVVITKDGVPRGIIVPTTQTTLLEDMQDLAFSRARRAVSAIRADAARSGTSRAGPEEIDREIRETRKARRRR